MTNKNRNKTRARVLQTATGDSYAACLQQVRDRETWLADTYGDYDWYDTDRLHASVDAWVADTAVLAWARAALPAGTHLTIDTEPGQPGFDGVVIYDPTSGWSLDLSAPDYYLGYFWRKPDASEWHPMANFLLGGDPLMAADVAADRPGAVDAAVAAINWIVGQFVARPAGGYDDTGRPASVDRPIWD